MKKPLLSSLLTIYTNALRLTQSNKISRDKKLSVLILPPAAPGSLGDEAMVSAVVDYLKDRGAKRVGFVSYGSQRWGDVGLSTEGMESQDHYLRSWKSEKAKFKFVQVVSRYDRFYCLGADVMDGYYSERESLQRLNFISLAEKMGAEAALLGFSFNEKPKPRVVQALGDLPPSIRVCARDPVSYKRLIHHVERPIKLVADLAFLLRPVTDSKISSGVLQWTREQRANDRVVIGINANYKLIQTLKVQSLDNLTQIYVDTIAELYSKNNQFSFVLMSHDFRNIKGEPNDVVLSEAIWKALPAEIQPHCIKVPSPCSAAEIKAICGDLDIALSGRMHLAIACLGQGTPAACITYQGKFEGLYQHFELDGMLIEPEQALQPQNLVRFFLPLIDKREDIRKHIQLKLPQVQQLAQTNFE